jgi:hypothetical protein
MSMIKTFNKAISNALNKSDETYTALFGSEDFTPEVEIVDSSDFNCGGLANELEYLRSTSRYFVRSFDIDVAEDTNLDLLVTSFIDLSRRNNGEPDNVYRNRYRSIAVGYSNPRRLTRWAIIDAIRYFLPDLGKVQVVEQFSSSNLYFQVRIEGAQDFDSVLVIGSTEQGFLDQNFVGGEGVGEVITYIGEIIDRVCAAGVDFDVLFINQYSILKTTDISIGSVQVYKTINGTIKKAVQFTKTISAEVV